jgi:hypothetical protein
LVTPAHDGDRGGYVYLPTGFDAAVTADGHGFDGVSQFGAGLVVPIHGRMDPNQGLHIEFDTEGNLPYCSKSYSFIATLSARLGPVSTVDAGADGG